MPRLFVNSMSNFIIHGGTVSFTLQDQAMKTEGGQPQPAPPEDIIDVVMTEAQFAQLVGFLNNHIEGFEKQTGRKLGAPAAAPPDGDGGGRRARPPQGSAMKIRPRGG